MAGGRSGGLLLIAALLLVACGDEAALDRLADGPVVMGVNAASGDTVRLADGAVLRLAGVEAPGPGRPYAREAQRALSRLVARQRLRTLYGGLPAGEGGAAAAQVRRVAGRLWLQGALLDAGAVRVRTHADDRALASEMLAREAKARRGRRGLWALSAYGVRLPDEVAPGEHGLMLVEGRVRKTGRWRGVLYLDFARDWRSVVSARIPQDRLREFRTAGLDPLDLQGRLVRVRGEFAWTDGAPVLALDHPEQVELLDDRR